MAQTPALQNLLGPVARPRDCTELNEATLERALATCSHTLYHPLGTCRMASEPGRGVVSPRHEVFGVPGLYVADGSVVPSSVSVNPQVTIMAMATRGADLLADRLDQPRAAAVA